MRKVYHPFEKNNILSVSIYRPTMIRFNWYRFSELSTQQLYAVLALRSEVFVVEQNCVYLDIDGNDQNALHLLVMENDSLVAYLRLLPPTPAQNSVIFGRVVTAKLARRKGYAKKLIQELLNYCDTHFAREEIKCSAQHYLTEFYEHWGFKTYSEVYEEDGIPHIAMRREPVSLCS